MNTPPQWVQHVLSPHHADSSDLRWAIETAAAMWARGDRVQGLRWLAHAVQTARGEGREERASELDRAVTELGRLADPSAAGAESTSRKRTVPYKVAPDDITHAVPPDAKLLEECEPVAVDSTLDDTAPDVGQASAQSAKPKSFERPRPPVSTPDLEPTMTAVGQPRSRQPSNTLVMHQFDPEISGVVDTSPDATRDAARDLDVTAREPMRFEETRPYGFGSSSIDSPASREPSSPQRDSGMPTTLESPQSPLEPMRAVRVAIENGVGSRFTVVLLADDEQAPDGTQEALLVPMSVKGETPES